LPKADKNIKIRPPINLLFTTLFFHFFNDILMHMKSFTLTVLACFAALSMQASVGVFQAGMGLNGTSYTAPTTIAAPFTQGTLLFNGGGASTYHDSGDEVCSVTMIYTVSGGGPSGSVPLVYQGAMSNNKFWAVTGLAVNISGMAPGSYTVTTTYVIMGRFGGVGCFSGSNPFTTSPLGVPSAPMIIGFTISAPLAVSLTRFDATRNQNSVDLTWTTAQENNHDRFVIERAGANMQWAEIAQIVNAESNRATTKKYTYADTRALNTTSHYRLRMVAADGSVEYSKVIVMARKRGTEVLVFPNPAQNELYVQADTESQIAIFNTLGNQVFEQNNVTDQTISISDLTAGMYLLVIKNNAGEVISTQKLIKN
jgi:Secretion system C-terminal sorting domain